MPEEGETEEGSGPTDREAPPEASEGAEPTKDAPIEGREKELTDRLARLQADFDNYRRRAREEASQAKSAGKIEFVKTLIPVLDNLDRALAHTEDEGLRLLAKQLQATLTGAGLALVSPEGEAFDAKVHEAIAQEAREGVKAGTVVAVVEKGYLFDGKLIRPARVVVAA